tara:strand:+ start:379 stop:675 length:297 start_codon:yes stop_codon:yes gene_type:complete
LHILVLNIGGLKALPSAKSYRVSERKRKINTPLRAKARTSVVKARALIDSNDLDGAQKAANDAVVGLDKAAQKGAIHKRNAARRKSRLMKRLQSAKSG